MRRSFPDLTAAYDKLKAKYPEKAKTLQFLASPAWSAMPAQTATTTTATPVPAPRS